jgi:hypothetical protein
VPRNWRNPRKVLEDGLFRPEFETGTSIFQVCSFVDISFSALLTYIISNRFFFFRELCTSSLVWGPAARTGGCYEHFKVLQTMERTQTV